MQKNAQVLAGFVLSIAAAWIAWAPACAVRDMFDTRSRRVGSANRNCAGIDFPVLS